MSIEQDHTLSTVQCLSDDFYFDSFDTEEVTCYVSGGYHPIIIGDHLGPTNERHYRIVHKLGWGSNATVWLAQKTESCNAFVAVKVTTAKPDGSLWRESAMLEAASKDQTDDTTNHVLTLLDHFTLQGPNGTHSVLVTDVVVPILQLLTLKHTPRWRKRMAHGLAQAVAQLHSKKIVHGGVSLLLTHKQLNGSPDIVFFRSPSRECRSCLPTARRPGRTRCRARSYYIRPHHGSTIIRSSTRSRTPLKQRYMIWAVVSHIFMIVATTG